MKFDIFKTILALAASALLGYICYTIAPETDNQHIAAWIICSISTALTLAPAMALTVPEANRRNFSGKMYLWACFAVVFLTNLIFSFFEHQAAPIIIIVGLELLIAAYVAYAILKK